MKMCCARLLPLLHGPIFRGKRGKNVVQPPNSGCYKVATVLLHEPQVPLPQLENPCLSPYFDLQ